MPPPATDLPMEYAPDVPDDREHVLKLRLSAEERALVEKALEIVQTQRKRRGEPYSVAGVAREQLLDWARRTVDGT